MYDILMVTYRIYSVISILVHKLDLVAAAADDFEDSSPEREATGFPCYLVTYLHLTPPRDIHGIRCYFTIVPPRRGGKQLVHRSVIEQHVADGQYSRTFFKLSNLDYAANS